MSKLIDKLIKEHKEHPTTEYDDGKGYSIGWYLAKPLPFYSIGSYLSRVKDAYRVLIDKSRAYHYKEDEVNEK